MNSRLAVHLHTDPRTSAHTHPQGQCGFQAWGARPRLPGAQSKSQKPEERV